MRVLLLGVGGFIGSHLVDRLLRDPSYVVEGLDLTDAKLEGVSLLPQFTFVQGDIRPGSRRPSLRCDSARPAPTAGAGTGSRASRR